MTQAEIAAFNDGIETATQFIHLVAAHIEKSAAGKPIGQRPLAIRAQVPDLLREIASAADALKLDPNAPAPA